jgi:hypothetical protein
MAGPNITQHTRIILAVINNQPGVGANISLPEDASQTFEVGSPLTTDSNPGYMTVWDGTPNDNGADSQRIIGFASTVGSNLASAGLGVAPPFGVDGGVQAAVTDPGLKPPFQTNAVVFPAGSRAINGVANAQLGNLENWFEAMVDNSAGTVAANYETSEALVGTTAGLTSDGNGGWYVDLNAEALKAVMIMQLSPVDGPGNVSGMTNGRVRFTVLPATYTYASVLTT